MVAAPHALGRSRHSGCVLQRGRVWPSVRAPDRVRGPAPRGHLGRRDGQDRRGTAEADRRAGAVGRQRPARCSRALVRVLRRQEQPGVDGRRTARRQGSASDGRRTAADRGAATGEGRARSGRLVRGSKPVRPLHHARRPGIDDAGPVRRRLSNRAGPGIRRPHHRDGSRNADHPARRTRARGAEDTPRHGRSPRTLGRQHARRRDHQLQQPGRLSELERRGVEDCRALHTHRSQHARVVGQRRGSVHLGEAVAVRR